MTLPLSSERHDLAAGVVIPQNLLRPAVRDTEHAQRHVNRPTSEIDAHNAVSDIEFRRSVNIRMQFTQHRRPPALAGEHSHSRTLNKGANKHGKCSPHSQVGDKGGSLARPHVTRPVIRRTTAKGACPFSPVSGARPILVP